MRLSTLRGSSASATSTPRRTTAWGSRSAASARRSTDRPRGEYVLSSKVGRLLEPLPVVDGLDDDGYAVPRTHRRVFDFSRDGIRRSFAESLDRIGVDRLDIAYLHDPDDHIPDVLATGLPALAELRAEGAVTAIGAGMNDSVPLARLVRETDIDVVMLAGRYTLLDQESLDDLLPACEERGVAVVAAGVFNSGILARSEPSRAREVRLRRRTG